MKTSLHERIEKLAVECAREAWNPDGSAFYRDASGSDTTSGSLDHVCITFSLDKAEIESLLREA